MALEKNKNLYPVQEQASLLEIWEYVPCECNEDCLCKFFDCSGHWKIKKGLTFFDILPDNYECLSMRKVMILS